MSRRKPISPAKRKIANTTDKKGSPVSGEIRPQISQITQIWFLIGETGVIYGYIFTSFR